jgi:hypothetical protein
VVDKRVRRRRQEARGGTMREERRENAVGDRKINTKST